MTHQASEISPGLLEWKNRLESDVRNPVFLKDLQWQLPEGITLDPVYDAGSLGEEHAYLQEFHRYWESCRSGRKIRLLASALCASSMDASTVSRAEELGFSAWSGDQLPVGAGLPLVPSFSGDPVSESLNQGCITPALQQLMAGNQPEFLHINATAFRNAGAGATEDLAYILSLGAHYHELLGEEGFARLLPTMVLHLSTGTALFVEIARLRALRLLWMNFTHNCGLEKDAGTIQAESSLTEWSKTDTDGNLLRHTACAMAAVLGGADQLLIHPHSLEAGSSMDALRQSVNLGHLCLEEAGMGAAFDPGSGTYLIEILTHKFAQQAWELFCSWQAVSLKDKLSSGFFSAMASRGAERLRRDFAEGRKVLTGVNKHPSPLSRPGPAWPANDPSESEFPAFRPVFLDA